uniref:G_PROTEIN_RECEP_F1_2 domain-containing protein n=1 Tax=Caenorhabditis tropicalis TaxID=1561998 RepID=A0A1I7UPL9_9PELO
MATGYILAMYDKYLAMEESKGMRKPTMGWPLLILTWFVMITVFVGMIVWIIFVLRKLFRCIVIKSEKTNSEVKGGSEAKDVPRFVFEDRKLRLV